jgi:hypothetical protein
MKKVEITRQAAKLDDGNAVVARLYHLGAAAGDHAVEGGQLAPPHHLQAVHPHMHATFEHVVTAERIPGVYDVVITEGDIDPGAKQVPGTRARPRRFG